MPFKVFALVSVHPEQEADFITAFSCCAAESRKEAGILQYELLREPAAPRRYIFNELYTDEAAFHQHMGTDHFKVFGESAATFFAGEPTVYFGEEVDV